MDMQMERQENDLVLEYSPVIHSHGIFNLRSSHYFSTAICCWKTQILSSIMEGMLLCPEVICSLYASAFADK